MGTWYSNGKLMLTGEYLVMEGAIALALPVKYGQTLEVTELPGNAHLYFETEVQSKPWFSAELNPETFEIYETTNIQTATYLQSLLKAANCLNPEFLASKKELHVTSRINFNSNWGLGSSSSFISNLAWWANVDPFALNNAISKGSGYDIACARSSGSIFYKQTHQGPQFESAGFKPIFKNNIFFVYLGKKQSTDSGIQTFKTSANFSSSDIYEISDIAYGFVKAQSIDQLIRLSDLHESIIGRVIGIEPIKQRMFADFEGTIKSLGAWGGDFCMVLSNKDTLYIQKYFEQKGLSTVIAYNEMVL